MEEKKEEPVEKVRYSDEELQEFKELILKKLEKARRDYQMLQGQIDHSSSNDTEDTSPSFKVLEEGSASQAKEEASQLAARQFIHLSSSCPSSFKGVPAFPKAAQKKYAYYISIICIRPSTYEALN